MFTKLHYYARIYALITSQYLKAMLHYRADFVANVLGLLISNVLGFLSIWVLFQNINSIYNWNYNELLFFYGYSLIAAAPMQIFFDNVWKLRSHLIEGTFIKYYFRPLNIMFYYMSEVIDTKSIGQLFLGLYLLIYSSNHLGIVWNVLNILIFCIFWMASSVVMISLVLLASSMGFWMNYSDSLVLLVFKLKDDFIRYPLDIFSQPLRYVFTLLLPIGFISYYPSRYFLRNDYSEWVYVIPLAAAGIFIFAVTVWNKGTKQYSGTGS